MLRSSATAVAALLVWATAAYTTRHYLRSRANVYIAAYWRAQIFLALALTVSVPAIYLWIDNHLGMLNASRWIANALILLAGYFLDEFFIAVTHGSPAAWRTHRWALLYLLATLGAMAWLLWRANLSYESVAFELPRVNAALIVYRMVFLAFFTFITIRLIVSCSRYRAATMNPTIRFGMQAMIIGGYWGIVYIGSTMAVVLIPSKFWLEPLLQVVVNLSILVAVVCILVGVNLPTLGQRLGILSTIQHLRYLHTYWRLHQVWQMLTDRVPSVVLPTSITWYAAVVKPQDMEFLLHRRVIEILDARRILDGVSAASPTFAERIDELPASGSMRRTDLTDQSFPKLWDVRMHGQMSEQSSQMRRQAREDAYYLQQLVAALADKDHRWLRDPGSQNEPMRYQPATYAEQLLYLETVADALRQMRSKPRMVLMTLKQLVAKGQNFMPKHLLSNAVPDEASAPNERANQVAQIVSEVANPLFVALPTFLIVALHTAPSWHEAILWWIVTTFGISVAPLLFVYQGVRRGRYSDHHLSVRTQRLVPLVVGLLCAAIALVLLLILQASPTLLATVAAVLVCGICTLAITTRWKISFHLVGAAGAATVIILLFGPVGLVLLPIVAAVGWARWQLKAHTVAQALAGTALAVVITIGMFRLFGLS
ncbi:MAG TPA: MAB_1171c family putative transporter [Ktedonobacterales bacterium]|jgi:hypothetical protein